MTKLAINGGTKVVDVNRKHFVWPPITENTKKAVIKQLEDSISIYDRSGIIEKLEDRFANYHNRKHSLLTSSGTAALHSAYVGVGLAHGDEVICPAYTFFATVTPILFTGAIPVLVDSKSDGNIDPTDIARHITRNTRCIVVTHMWGLPCDMKPILDIAKAHNLSIIEDASHAHGATYYGNLVGTFGDVAAYSLQAQKTLVAGEGGVLLTDNDEIFYRTLMLGHYNKRCKSEIPKSHPLHEFSVTGMGLKLRIHALGAAIADEQFDNLELILESRQSFADKMRERLGNLPGIRIPLFDENIKPSWYAFILQYVAEELEGLSIERFYQALIAEGCLELDRPGSTCPLNYHPLFQKPEVLFANYKDRFSYRPGDFPGAEKFHENSLKLPVWHLPEDEKIMNLYVQAFEKVIENYKDLL